MPFFMDLVIPVGVGFAIVLVGASRPTFGKSQLLKYVSYILISVGTYFLLFESQPWDFLFGWIPENLRRFSGIPVSPCSVIMAFAGWLLLSG